MRNKSRGCTGKYEIAAECTRDAEFYEAEAGELARSRREVERVRREATLLRMRQPYPPGATDRFKPRKRNHRYRHSLAVEI